MTGTSRRKNRGSLSIESAISIMATALILLSFCLLLEVYQYQEEVKQLTHKTVSKIAMLDLKSDQRCRDAALILLSPRLLNSKFNLNLDKAELLGEGYYRIELSWKIKLPIGESFKQSYGLTGRMIMAGKDGILDGGGGIVFVTESGEKYHWPSCIHLRKSKAKMSRSEAENSGYEPCWHCIGGLKPFEKAPGKLGDQGVESP